MTESYNEFCDNYNTIHLYEAHKDFLEAKINRTHSTKRKDQLNEELSKLIADNEQSVTRAIKNQKVYLSTAYSEKLSNCFYNVQDYLFGTSIDVAGKRKKAREFRSLLTEFFGDSTSLIITGKRGCVILLPEYIVIKRYNSSPFICKLYEDDILNVVLQKEVLYKESIHCNREDTVKTVWKHSKLDGSKDSRYKKDNPSTQYIDIADFNFRYNTGFETIKRSCPFERYRDGQEFLQIWKRFISENMKFVQANWDPLNIEPSDNSVPEEVHDAALKAEYSNDAVEDAMFLPDCRHNAENIPAESPVVLRRIIKQILEYYFIQISGYDGQSLTDRILKKEEGFLKDNPDGTKNNDMLHAVNALLHYVGSDQVGFNNGFTYVDDSEDIEQMRETFKCIFTALDQEQHFDMMMETVR